MAARPPAVPTWTSLVLQPIALAIALGVLVAAYSTVDLYRDREAMIADARAEMANYTRLLAEAAERTLDAADIALTRMADHLGPDVAWSAFDPVAARLAAERYLRSIRAPIDIVLYDEAGTPRFSYRRALAQMANLGGQAFFEAHRRSRDAGTAYGPPFAGPTTGATIVPISRRLSRADGSFAGVMVAGSLDVLLRDFPQSLEFGRSARMTILRDDGLALWRQPPLADIVGRSFAGTAMFAPERAGTAADSVVEAGRLTAGDIVYAYRRLADRPLVVTVGVEMSAVLAPWWNDAIHHAAAFALIVLAIAWATWRRIQADLGLRRSHERLRSILSTMAEGLLVIRADGSVAEANPAAAAIVGMPFERLLRANLHRDALPLVDVDGRPVGPDRSATRAALYGGEARSGSILGLLRSGAPTRWLSLNAAPIRGGGGDIEAAVVTFSDVTERHEAELALAQSRQRLAEVFAVLAEGVTVRDAEGRIIDVNPAAEAILGRPREQILGTAIAPDQTLPWAPVDESGAPIANSDNPAFAVYAGRQPIKNRVIGIHRPDGSRRWIAVNNRPSFDDAGAITVVVSSFADVTDARAAEIALRESQRRYAAIVDTLAEGVILRDARGVIVDANPAALEILGRPREAVLGIGIDEQLPWQPVDENGVTLRGEDRHITRTVRTGETMQGRIIGVHRPDGSRRWISTSNRVMRDEKGAIALVLSSFIDVTDQRRTESARAAEHRALTLSTQDAPLPEVLEALCLAFERDFPALKSSVLLADEQARTLRHGAAPSMPREFCESVNGLAFGPDQGSCGTAAFRRELVICADIGSDALWAKYRDLAARYGFGACWSMPLFGDERRLLGTFAVYARDAHQPTPDELAATERIGRAAAVAIGRVHAREALRQSEALYRSLVETIPDGVLIAQDGTVCFVNAAAAAMAGAPPDALLGSALEALVDPRDHDQVREQHRRRMSGEDALAHYTVRVRRLDGRPGPIVDLRAVRISHRGRPATLAALTDITEQVAIVDALRQSREQMRSTIDAMAEGLIVRRPDLTIVDANAAAAAILGTPREALIGSVRLTPDRPMFDQDGNEMRFEDRPSAVAVQTGKSVRGRVISLARPDGVRRWLSFNTELARRPDGAVETVVTTFSDITDQRESERALRESEERYRRLVEFLPTPLVVLERGGRIAGANAAACRLFAAAAPHDLIGRQYDDLVHPDDRAEVRRLRDEGRAGPPPSAQLERRYVSLAGREMVCEVSTGSIGGADRFEMILAIHDVTDRRAAERAVRDLAERLQTVADNLPLLVVLVDRDERITFINRAGAAWYARPPDAIVGLTLREALGDAEYERRSVPLARVLAGEELRMEAEFRYPDGAARQVEALYVPRRAGGAVTGFFVFTEDVTTRRAAERSLRDLAERLQLVTDHLPMLVGYVDQDERMQFINRTGAQWFGRPASEIVGRRLDELFDAERFANRRAMVRRALAGEQVRFDGTFLHPDGTVRLTESNFVPHVVEGRVRGYFGFTTDVTDRVHTEEQLRQAQKMEAVGQLTGGVAHDFNNLLAIIMGNLELLADRHEPGSLQAALAERALRATRRGAELTRRLLAFSRRQTLQPERVEINALVAGLTDLLGRTLGENIRVETRLAGDVEAVLVDPGQLENALLNLAVNARDAMPRGGRLLIETANVELDADYVAALEDVAPGRYVMLAVSDTGEGMTPAVVARAFEPFFTTKEVGKGSGLGLSMVYGFVKQSGGHVAIYSEHALGTTIRLYLPRMAGAGAAAAAAAETTTAGLSGSGQSIVVVEDDPDVRQLVASQLAALGYVVRAAANGSEAIALVAEPVPLDLLLTDVVLPGGMSGADIAAQARRRRPGLRVLYMSGYAEGMINEETLRADNAQLLQKPFARAQLARAVRAALDKAGPAS